jgi:hypothetical protein
MSFTIAEKPIPAGREGPGIFLEPVDPLTHPGWDDLVAGHPSGSVFHSSFWARVLAESYGYCSLYLTAMRNGGISVLLPVMEVDSRLTGRRGVGLPFSDYCDPLVSEEEAFRTAWSHLVAHGEAAGWKSIELRCREALPEDFPSSATFHHHVLDLWGGEELLFRSLRESTRRNIRKAKREGVTVTVSGSEDSVAQFCRLNAVTRRDHGLPPQPARFFRSLHEHLLKRNGGFVVLAHFRGSCIGAAVFLHFGDRAYYKYGASDRRAQHLRANNLVMWEAVRSCAGKGFRSLCLGRTDPGNEGLRRFKNGWGAREGAIRHCRYDLGERRFVRSRPAVTGWHNALFRNLPLAVSRAVGTALYKHLG